MDQIFGIFFMILNMFIDKAPCPQPYIHYEYTYTIPQGLEEASNWNEDGYFYVNDEFGNSMEVVYLNEADFQAQIDQIQVPIIQETVLDEGTYKFVLDNPGPYEPYDTVFLVSLDEDIVKLYMYNQGDSRTHAVFEEKALELARSIAQGVTDETDDFVCGNPTFWDLLSE